ncbi:MAG: hypothetical protein MI920_24540 [Kiloniellales bacterium]|nr:hypothetical protein [Kiloniellales bacterium]
METTKKESSRRQIKAAISHLQKGELDCAITLAGAAEGILPATGDPHLFKAIRECPEAEGIDLNLVINWLKHAEGPEPVNISEFEATLTIARAISKFIAVYHQSTRRFEQFLRWGHEAGHLPKMHREKPE